MTKHTLIAMTGLLAISNGSPIEKREKRENRAEPRPPAEKLEVLVKDQSTNWRAIRDQRNQLFAEAEPYSGRMTSGALGTLSWANREWIEALVRARRFEEAAAAMKAHVDFCEKEPAGLYGRNERNWIDFVQLHARVWSELGHDPLKGRNMIYQLSEDKLGYHALCLTGSWNGSRSAEVGQITWNEIPADETVGKCILMDHLGRMTSEVDIGFAWPSDERSLQKRLRAIYYFLDDKPPLIREPVDKLLTTPR